jgi:hypothetical protein
MAEEMAEETEFHKFKRHVENNSVVEMVLKAHLIIEDTLMETLRFLLPHPGHVKPETMSFYDKVSLCGALGFISEYEIAALLTFNTLRNDTAHQLDTEISMADLQQVNSWRCSRLWCNQVGAHDLTALLKFRRAVRIASFARQ